MCERCWPGFITMATGIPSRLKKGALLQLASRKRATNKRKITATFGHFPHVCRLFSRLKVPSVLLGVLNVTKSHTCAKTFDT